MLKSEKNDGQPTYDLVMLIDSSNEAFILSYCEFL